MKTWKLIWFAATCVFVILHKANFIVRFYVYLSYMFSDIMKWCDGLIWINIDLPLILTGRCIDGDNKFTCLCDKFYTGVTCDTLTDPCDSSPCLNGGFCCSHSNSDVCQLDVPLGQYQCHCKNGYSGM